MCAVCYNIGMEAHDPLLKARKEALSELADVLNDAQYRIAEYAIDTFMDMIEKDIEKAEDVELDSGHLVLTVNNLHGTQETP